MNQRIASVLALALSITALGTSLFSLVTANSHDAEIRTRRLVVTHEDPPGSPGPHESVRIEPGRISIVSAGFQPRSTAIDSGELSLTGVSVDMHCVGVDKDDSGGVTRSRVSTATFGARVIGLSSDLRGDTWIEPATVLLEGTKGEKCKLAWDGKRLKVVSPAGEILWVSK